MTEIMTLPQEEIEVDGIVYFVTAMPATKALQFMEKNLQNAAEAAQGKINIDLSVIKKLICETVTKDNKSITEKSFDIIFARKVGHVQKLFERVLEYNFEDVFQESGSEE